MSLAPNAQKVLEVQHAVSCRSTPNLLRFDLASLQHAEGRTSQEAEDVDQPARASRAHLFERKERSP